MNFKKIAVNALDMSGAALLMRPFYQGRGSILGLHRVLPANEPAPEPGNVIRVEQLREALEFIRRGGWDFVSLDEVPERLRQNKGRFVAVTLDDGYADNLIYGLPVFREFSAPFTVFPVTGFVSRTRCYWPTLAAALLDSGGAVLEQPGRGTLDCSCAPGEEKLAVMERISHSGWRTEEIERSMRAACEARGLNANEILDRSFLSWDQLRVLASDPLASIGVHTISHAALATLPPDEAAREMSGAREELESKLGIRVRHIAYPYGAPGTCGEREFGLAREMGFVTGCTTKRGNVQARHAGNPWSLPRHTLSMCSHSASVRYLRISLYGVWDSPINGTVVTR